MRNPPLPERAKIIGDSFYYCAIQRGTDGVITDDPGLAVRIREELAELNALERILLLFRDLMPEAELATKTNGEM